MSERERNERVNDAKVHEKENSNEKPSQRTIRNSTHNVKMQDKNRGKKNVLLKKEEEEPWHNSVIVRIDER